MAPPRSDMYSFLFAQLYSRSLRLGPNRRAEWKEVFRRDCVNVLSILVRMYVRVCVCAVCACVCVCVFNRGVEVTVVTVLFARRCVWMAVALM